MYKINRGVLRTKRILFTTIVAAGVLAATVAPASAEANGGTISPVHYLRPHGYMFNSTTGNYDNDPAVTPKWSSGSDSPIDTNDKALRVTIPEPIGTYFAEAYTRKSLVINTAVGNVKNVSFDFDKTLHIGGGAPRIIVIFNDGDVAFLAASGCNSPIGVSSTWARADFTGDKTDCHFDVTDGDTQSSTTYSADGVHTAWQNYAAANSDQVVSYTDLVFDEPGPYAVDRIALGTNKLYNYSNTRAKDCQNKENLC